MSVYRLIVFVHIISSMGFLMAHGISAAMMFKVSRERSYNALCSDLELSGKVLNWAMRFLDGVLLSGITLTVWARWWRFGWVWASIGLFIAVAIFMAKYGSGYMNRVRRAIGVVKPKEFKKGVRPRFVPQEELEKILEQGKPRLVALGGLSGLAAIVLLMVTKPF